MNRRTILPVIATLILAAGAATAQTPVDTGWTYQGKLTDAGVPANGTYDLRFSCYLDDQGTTQSGPTIDVPGMAVDHGLFTARLDFGVQFTGYKNWLLIEVSPAGAGTYTALPLQEITSSPQSLFSMLPWATTPAGISYTLGGSVGIGTSSPVGAFEVATPGSALLSGGSLGVTADSTPFPANAGAGVFLAGGHSDTAYVFGFDYGSYTPLNLSLNSPGGNVGVGTASPEFPLTVQTGTNLFGVAHTDGNITLATYVGGGGNGGYIGTVSNHPLHFYTANSGPLMTVTTSGGVGIGTTAPVQKLAVIASGSQGAVYGTTASGRTINGWVSTYAGWGVAGTNTYGNCYGILGGGDVGVYGNSASTNSVAARFVGPVGGIAVDVVQGLTRVKTLQILGGSDLAEPFNVSAGDQAGEIEPGMVVVIDPSHPGDLRLTDRSYDSKVAGIISGANGLEPGLVMKAPGHEHADGKYPVAMTGRVWCWCDASSGAITPGDRLTTSPIPGHAMRADDPARSQGAVIGKAMTELKEGKGLVLVLVNPQ